MVRNTLDEMIPVGSYFSEGSPVCFSFVSVCVLVFFFCVSVCMWREGVGADVVVVRLFTEQLVLYFVRDPVSEYFCLPDIALSASTENFRSY